MFTSISKYTWFSFVPFTMLGLLTVALFVTKIIPVSYLWFTLIGWIFIAGLGISVGYHRLFSHNCYPNISTWKENLILFLGSLGGQGSSITWTAVHRGYHHRHSDTIKDIHSPIHGKWYSFFGWTAKITEKNPIINLAYAGNLLRKPNHIWFHHNQLRLMWLVPITLALFDWKLSLALLCLPASISIVADNFINLAGHTKLWGSYRNFDTNDMSQNNVVLGYLTWGLGFHNNHHQSPNEFKFSVKWYEFDPGTIFLPFVRTT